jgi:CheY-like chemotaxis protein
MSIKVLVADDSITIQKVIGIIFGGDEYSLTIVDNGKAAVDKAREITPDILLIDALMPGMSGYEVAEAVRSTPSLAAKPILILTGSFEPFDEEKAKKSGADDFIAKPFESQQIITKVKELLELGKSRASSAASQSQPAFEVIDIPTPVFAQQHEAPEKAPADIWGAFTQDIEPPAATVTPPSAAAVEQDVFAIVHEENDAQLIQTPITADISPQDPVSQWFPVEENTFEFEEEVNAESQLTAFAEQTAPTQKEAFGDIAFEDDAATPAAAAFSAVPASDFNYSNPPSTAFEAPPLSDSSSFAEKAVPAAPTTTAALTEEQLKAAIAAASKEVIERIVWEVVPDLAEALIREAIRKIKEGV